MKKKSAFKASRENLFADIDVPNIDEHLIEVRLVYKISQTIKTNRLT